MTAAAPCKNTIIADLFRGKNFNDCINKFAPDGLRDDLRQEIGLRLCELNDDKVVGLHGRGELEFYTVRIIINELRNKTNGFAKKYRTYYAELTNNEAVADESDFEERERKELIEQLAFVELDSLEKRDWYAHRLIKLYQEHGTFRALQDLTGIPHVSCYKTIKKSLAELKRLAIDPAARPQPKTQTIRI